VRTEGRTDRCDEANSRFLKFCERALKMGCAEKKYYFKVNSKYPHLLSEVTEFPRPEEVESDENKANLVHRSSTRSDNHTVEVLKNISPLPYGKHHKITSKEMHC
jgi:hypothetical protein